MFDTGVLNGPDIRKLIKSEIFENELDYNHLNAWMALKNVIEHVLGKNRAQPAMVEEYVETMMKWYHQIESSMTLKMHFMDFHLDAFLKELPTESDEQGERFHQVTMPMERRFRGKRV